MQTINFQEGRLNLLGSSTLKSQFIRELLYDYTQFLITQIQPVQTPSENQKINFRCS